MSRAANRNVNRTALAMVSIASSLASLATLAGCGDHASTPPPAPSADTLWIAPNGSEVVLKLVSTPPTVPF